MVISNYTTATQPVLHSRGISKGEQMKTAIITYSLTGNNADLGRAIAAELGVNPIEVAPIRPRTIPMIALDMMLGRLPEITPEFELPDPDDLVVLVAPIWMGRVPSPMRTVLRRARGCICRYLYVSLCGGADGENAGVAGDLSRRVGVDPIAVLEYPITDVLADDADVTRATTSAYRASQEDIRGFSEDAVRRIRSILETNGSRESFADVEEIPG